MSAAPHQDTTLVRTLAAMGTVVSVQVVGHGASARARRERARAVDRAIAWFSAVEAVCSRFDDTSELRRVCVHVGTPVAVSPMLFEAVQFAVAVADAAEGAFDPTIGAHMESRGFHHDYRSQAVVASGIADDDTVSYRDIELDADTRSITLHRPLLLDLGAVAKGLAIDMAVRELATYTDFAIDAGGDLYLSGLNEQATPWTVGVRDPATPTVVRERITVSDAAVCTSGDYERPGHLVSASARTGTTTSPAPRTRGANETHTADDHAVRAASVTTIAPSAMVADAMGTAAYVLGPAAGIPFLEAHDIRGLILTTSGERRATHDWPHD
ncbi:MAG: FAD:protein FMN transferase [Gemmatimonadaceae bacterium]|nr:FAD:protein FMN transferase [Gemmatimonadaceae bacterium]